jgi:predicted XRE-type DNA-binding protein
MKQTNEAIKQAYRMNLAKAFKKHLKEANKTQKQASIDLGITESEVSRILRGQINIGIDTLALLINYMNQND